MARPADNAAKRRRGLGIRRVNRVESGLRRAYSVTTDRNSFMSFTMEYRRSIMVTLVVTTLMVCLWISTMRAFVIPPPGSKLDFRTLEVWLSVREGAVPCNCEPSSVPRNHWYINIVPDLAPEFSLLSAWLKTEAPLAMAGPENIPPMYKDNYTMGGKVQMWGDLYFNQAYLGSTAMTAAWTNQIIQENIEKAKKREGMKYGEDGLRIHDMVIKYKSYVESKRGIVIGSEDPWVEAILIHHGAGKLLTVEFGQIVCEHPQIDTMLPSTFTESFLNSEIEQFDFGITFSSLEHDGLGRYGDVLNPWGDLQSMAKMLSVIKPGGLFFIAVPTAGGVDALQWNAHRVYGLHRLPKLFAGWKLINVIGKEKRHLDQPLFVLQNRNGCSL